MRSVNAINISKRLFSILLPAVVFGCATQTTGWTPLPYEEAEYAPYKVAGTGVVKGQVFMKTRGGDIKKGAGNGVYLMPATSYGDQRYREGFINGKFPIVNPDPKHAEAVIKKITDGEGRFEFKSVPEGKYYVYSSVTWEVPSTNRFMAGQMETQGGNIIAPIKVTNNETTDIVLTR